VAYASSNPIGFSIAAASGNEGSPLSFTVTRPSTTVAATVNYATSNGTALHGVNYTTTTGTLNFPAGVSSAVFTVPTIDDLVVTSNLNMTVTLSSPSIGSNISNAAALGTINNIDIAPSLSIASSAASEGSPLTFTVSRSGATGGAATVNYATSNGTAASGTNYTATSGTLSFAAGVTPQTFTVPTIDDHVYTSNLTMTATLSAPSAGTTLGTSTATGTVANTDAQPSLSIAAASVNEGSEVAWQNCTLG
jgi:hypothetical protein